MSEGRCSVPARLGIVALNLLAPGLGILRIQRARAALMLLTAPLVILGMICLAYAMLTTMTFGIWATLVAITAAAMLSIYVSAFAISWRGSKFVQPPGPWWSRWYGIAGAWLAIVVIGLLVPDFTNKYYKTFYMPAESMAPTLLVNDRLLASMRGPGVLRRGDIILFNVGAAIYVKRVAGLPGDRIAMENGAVILNGRAVAQRLLGVDRVPVSAFGVEARRLSEQFAGESVAHQIYDSGYSPNDDMPEQLVAPGHVFVLGDNRDHSADSRVARDEMGVEQLPIGDIRGRALFRTWGPSGRTGEPLNH
jgi:signal peptidase I